jgi:YgiT-type zinc finger domain-containing protein
MTKACPACRVGRLRERPMTYIEWYGRTPIVASRMPALVCDVCREWVYDDQAMESLHQLIWSEPPKRTRSLPNPGGQ